MTRLAQWLRRRPWAAALVIFLGLNMAGWVTPALDALGRGYVARSNDAYLDEAEGRAMETFLVLSAVKAGLAVLQSSEAGVSLIVQMKVQVGKVIESLVDTVDVGWKVSLLSLTVLCGTRILLKLAAAAAGPLLSLLLMALLLQVVIPLHQAKVRAVVRAAGTGLMTVTLAVILLLPLSVFLGSAVSRRITAPMADDARDQIQVIHQELAGAEPAPVDVRVHVQTVIDRFKSISQRVGEKLSILGRQVAQRIAVTVFDVLVFPLLFLLPSLLLARTVASHVFDHVSQPAFGPSAEAASAPPLPGPTAVPGEPAS